MHEWHGARRLDREADRTAMTGALKVHGGLSTNVTIVNFVKVQSCLHCGVRNIVFIGGGNMAQALVGGLVKGGRPGASIIVIEPSEATRRRLVGRYGATARSAAGPFMEAAEIVVWAVKPQAFEAAAKPCEGHVGGALQVSVMAGVRSDAIAAATGSERVVRAMPNTPALIGQGIAGLFARAAVTEEDRADATALLGPTGELIWIADEAQLDAVTALSGSGPAYVFLVLEALLDAGRQMGLPPQVARRLAEQTVAGSAALAAASPEAPAELRRHVTSPGGTTEAAVNVLESRAVRDAFVAAVLAARAKAEALGKTAPAAPRSTLLPPP
jgi:pyrroline-5-carboxylate reductase